MNREDKFQTTEKMLEEHIETMSKALIATQLLRKVYLEFGPYQNGKISKATWDKVKSFAGFDDSE